MFIGFPNFYQYFIQGFSKITALLTFMLKTTGSSKKSISKTFRANDNEVVGDGSKTNETVRNSYR